MEIGGLGNVSSAYQDSTATTATQDTLDKDAFLRLLVAQLQNQDPLSPMDNQEYIAQLTQFSSLEQLQNLNSSMASSLTMQQSSLNGDALQMLGREVAAITSGVIHEVDGTYDFSTYMDQTGSLRVTVTDEDGNEIYTETMRNQSGEVDFTWDGTTTSGEKAAEGKYNVKVERLDNSGEMARKLDLYLNGIVQGIDFSLGYPVLSISGQDVPINSIVRINVVDDNG
jgi:flagellar basal-body rod modification protein FlgD